MKKLQTVISNNLAILYSDLEMKNIFPEGTINVTYQRGRSYFFGKSCFFLHQCFLKPRLSLILW